MIFPLDRLILLYPRYTAITTSTSGTATINTNIHHPATRQVKHRTLPGVCARVACEVMRDTDRFLLAVSTTPASNASIDHDDPAAVTVTAATGAMVMAGGSLSRTDRGLGGRARRGGGRGYGEDDWDGGGGGAGGGGGGGGWHWFWG